jgi:uncharacterized protein YjbI with pentapeptide repeats
VVEVTDPEVASSTPPLASRQSRQHALLPRWTAPVVAVLVISATALVLVLLWRWIDGLALTDPVKKATAHLDAVKVAASIAVAGGGLFALYLAARRQRIQELELSVRHDELAQRDQVQAHTEKVSEINRVHAERVAAASERDAVDRRITELYAKSVEQLGSDKAPVRLGGLYALERLAQDNPHQRPTAVNVLCAYLRMPYPPSLKQPGDDADEQVLTKHAEYVQERQVRLTAQRILAAHLRRPPKDTGQLIDTFWPDTDLDLAGATLIGFELEDCELGSAYFDKATFVGTTRFTKTAFTKSARFTEATFTRSAYFSGAKFTQSAMFIDAIFTGKALFINVKFNANAWFLEAAFEENATFDGTKFSSDAWFSSVTFLEKAGFSETTFAKDTRFVGTTFTKHARFNGAAFAGRVRFDEKVPADRIQFDGALIAHSAAEATWPTGWHQTEPQYAIGGREGTWHYLVTVLEDPPAHIAPPS